MIEAFGISTCASSSRLVHHQVQKYTCESGTHFYRRRLHSFNAMNPHTMPPFTHAFLLIFFSFPIFSFYITEANLPASQIYRLQWGSIFFFFINVEDRLTSFSPQSSKMLVGELKNERLNVLECLLDGRKPKGNTYIEFNLGEAEKKTKQISCASALFRLRLRLLFYLPI